MLELSFVSAVDFVRMTTLYKNWLVGLHAKVTHDPVIGDSSSFFALFLTDEMTMSIILTSIETQMCFS